MQEEIRRRVESGRPKEQSGAWRTLLELSRADSVSWAAGSADANWPDDPETQLGLITPQMRVGWSDWLRARLAALIPRMAPNQLDMPVQFFKLEKAPDELGAVLEWLGSSTHRLWPFTKFGDGFLTLAEWVKNWSALSQVPAESKTWQFLYTLVRIRITAESRDPRRCPERGGRVLARSANTGTDVQAALAHRRSPRPMP